MGCSFLRWSRSSSRSLRLFRTCTRPSPALRPVATKVANEHNMQDSLDSLCATKPRPTGKRRPHTSPLSVSSSPSEGERHESTSRVAAHSDDMMVHAAQLAQVASVQKGLTLVRMRYDLCNLRRGVRTVLWTSLALSLLESCPAVLCACMCFENLLMRESPGN